MDDNLAFRTGLSQRILRFIEDAEINTTPQQEVAFNKLALDVFAWQYTANQPYQSLCNRRNATPEHVHHWSEIPAVTTTSFKSMPLFCFEPEKARAVFHTSGTTQEKSGKHFFYDLELYRSAALRWFKTCCLASDEKIPFLVLGPTASLFPHSSLGQMFSWIIESFSSDENFIAFTKQGIDFKNARDFLEVQANKRQAVFILSTSLALLEFTEYLQEACRFLPLPQGSTILDTGGYKGRKKAINRDDLQHLIKAIFQVPPDKLFNEYGMTEMSSQFYETGIVQENFNCPFKLSPPWVRSLACEPQTLQRLPIGEKGTLRHFDLANLDSIAMLQTEDLGIVHERGIELSGRPLHATPRGCSLLAEEIIEVNPNRQQL